jgi:lipid II:glycine glycyltransferase (peptidoglycan interpeptide bridge formation enzyme)
MDTRLTFEFSTSTSDLSWDTLLDSCSGSHFEQTSGWGAVRAHYGWKVARIVAKRGNLAVSGIQALTRRISRLGTIGYVSRGPTSREGVEVQKLLVQEIDRIAKKERWLYCVFDYPYYAHELAQWMAGRGYIAHPTGIPPSGLLTATALLDLRPSEEEILGRMTTNARRDVRKGQRSGMTFAEGTQADLPRFRELMLATCARRNVAPTPPQKDYFDHLWTELNPGGRARLFLVRYGDEIISAAFAFTVADTIRVWKVGWSGSNSEKEPNRWMWWEILKWAKAHGFITLDFVWVDTEDAKSISAGKRSSRDFRDGTTFFKLGFGGTLHFPPPVQSKFFHPLARVAYNCGGAQVLASKSFRRVLARYWSAIGR